MKREISEIQRLNKRLIQEAEQAGERAKKIAAGPRAQCSIEKGPSGGNYGTMAFLVRIEAANPTSFGQADIAHISLLPNWRGSSVINHPLHRRVLPVLDLNPVL
jgi:hypothetical protein